MSAGSSVDPYPAHAAEAYLPDEAGNTLASKVDPDAPCNPGTYHHLSGKCKPCNKYNPERPDDSCKHAETCAFCHHKEHERPKHRGQRGRHALQRRQFLEARKTMNIELEQIISRIYQEPPVVLDSLKGQLKRLQQEQPQNQLAWNEQVQFLVEEIAVIGDKAQAMRPDNERVRRARGGQTAVQVDLESRLKWYTGTLHLMVRKMFDDGSKPEDEKLKEIREVVDDSLREFKELEKKLSERLSQEDGMEDSVKVAVGANQWLADRLSHLVQEERRTTTDFKQVWDELRSELSFMLDIPDTQPCQQEMRNAPSLNALLRIVRRTVESQRSAILGEDEEEEDSS